MRFLHFRGEKLQIQVINKLNDYYDRVHEAIFFDFTFSYFS